MADSDFNSKRCTSCGDLKRLADYNKKKSGKFGLQPICRACQKEQQAAWRSENPVKVKENNRDWYSRNRVSALEKLREYRQLNKSELNAVRREAYRVNPEIRNAIYRWRELNPGKFKKSCARYSVLHSKKIIEKSKIWRAKNPERVASSRRAWIAMNIEKWREIGRASSAGRRARKRNAGGTITRANIRKLFTLQRAKCACCKSSIRNGYHVDHVFPLALGGSNRFENI
jgi:hypothetical protein